MDTDDYSVEAVLKEARRFVVPLYQRKYQWDDERLNPFWEDVEAKAQEVLNCQSRSEHYMGALILSPVGTGSQIGRTPVIQVVDGQQRLTTFQLFLAALREVARDYDLTDIMEQVTGYLKNDPKSKEKDEPLAKFKLTPTPSDRDIFHDIIEMKYEELTRKYKELFWGKQVPKNTYSPAFRAYTLFRKWIKDFCHSGPSDEWLGEYNNESEEIPYDSALSTPAENTDEDEDTDIELISGRFEALLKAVLEHLKLVVITLGENDDAQVIFETLNSKGKPLLAMDLVRNNIFHRAEKQNAEVEELYKRLWNPFDNPWWREAAPNARPKRPRIDHFLGHVLAAETGIPISMRELYAKYRNFAVPKGRCPRFPDVEDELRLLEHYAPLYETLEGRLDEDADLAWFGRKMAAWQVTTVYPVALQIGNNLEVPSEMRRVILELLYSYIARRVVCGLTTKNLNKTFQGLASEFKENGVSFEGLRAYFSEKTGDSTRFPSNDEFVRGIHEQDAHRIAPLTRLIDIFWELEMASRSSLAENTNMPEGLWVEHILPQAWTEDWPFKDGQFVDSDSLEPKAMVRRSKIHSLGNLTLLTASLNQNVSNKKFSIKQEQFSKHTGLFLNKWFQDHEKWDEEEITIRGEHLSELSLKIWKPLV